MLAFLGPRIVALLIPRDQFFDSCLNVAVALITEGGVIDKVLSRTTQRERLLERRLRPHPLRLRPRRLLRPHHHRQKRAQRQPPLRPLPRRRHRMRSAHRLRLILLLHRRSHFLTLGEMTAVSVLPIAIAIAVVGIIIGGIVLFFRRRGPCSYSGQSCLDTTYTRHQSGRLRRGAPGLRRSQNRCGERCGRC